MLNSESLLTEVISNFFNELSHTVLISTDKVDGFSQEICVIACLFQKTYLNKLCYKFWRKKF